MLNHQLIFSVNPNVLNTTRIICLLAILVFVLHIIEALRLQQHRSDLRLLFVPNSGSTISRLSVFMEQEEEYKKAKSILRDLEQSLLSDDNLTKV